MQGKHATGIVLGGGLSGLLLAERLAGNPENRTRVTVVEPRTAYDDDRTWSFWRVGPHRFEHLVEQGWDRFAWSAAGWRQPARSKCHPYQSIPSARVYGQALNAIHGSDLIDLQLGTTAHGVRELATGVEVVTDRGVLKADWVIDTRPMRAPEGVIVQRFEGARIKTGSASFDPTCAGIMEDMRVDQLGFGFVYLLPFSPDEALIEVTRFATAPLPAGLLEAELSAACARLANGGYEVVRREHGAIPMSVDVPVVSNGNGRIVDAGRRGGAARPSTGYAFQRIDSWAERASGEIAAGRMPSGHPADSPLYRTLDRIFLQVLANHPELAPSLFLALAAHTPVNCLVRFLSDAAGPFDVAAVVAALPPLPFLGALIAPARSTVIEEALA